MRRKSHATDLSSEEIVKVNVCVVPIAAVSNRD